MYNRTGISKAIPKGYSPDPSILVSLLTKAVSDPEKGIYIYDPIILSPDCNSKKGLIILSTKDIMPSVTLR